MSAPNKRESWLERWGLVLVIFYGLIFLSVLVTFQPKS